MIIWQIARPKYAEQLEVDSCELINPQEKQAFGTSILTRMPIVAIANFLLLRL
jgi:hypothetical protein